LQALDEFYQRIAPLKDMRGAVQMISYAVDIGFHSPRCFPIIAAIISKLITVLNTK
jgi:hypothetical protein